MKKISILLMMTLILGLTACGSSDKKNEIKEEKIEASIEETEVIEEVPVDENTVRISLANDIILVNEEEISEDPEADIYKANDIIFYLEDQGIEYGEGTREDEHSQIEGDAHTVVHITKPGTYELTGTMDAGQIFVDLGEDAKEDPTAVVNLILKDVDITCTVAPGIFFYNVYECAEEPEDEEDATMDVDTKTAGANVQIADDSSNKVYGSYVAKIYESCELNEEGTEVVDSKKLHKYDAAVYSRMSMNVYGNTGKLSIAAENEGLDTEKHLTIYGGTISIKSGNDGINVNEEEISVFTLNGGTLNIQVTGETGEGDGIDSNGWLVINDGTLKAQACATSADAGIDADKGIYINGGTVIASGNMPAEIAGGEQKNVSFMIQPQPEAEGKYKIKDTDEETVLELSPKNTFSMLVVSFPEIMEDGTYSLWQGDTKLADSIDAGMMRPGMGGMKPPAGFDGERPEMPEDMDDQWPPMPEGMEPPKDMNGKRPGKPEKAQ